MRIAGLVLSAALAAIFATPGARQSAGVEDGTVQTGAGCYQSVGRQRSALAPRSRWRRWRMANRPGAGLERWMGSSILWRAAPPSWRMGDEWRARCPCVLGLCSWKRRPRLPFLRLARPDRRVG